MKVIGSNIYISVYDKRDGFGFPRVNFLWLSGDIRRLTSHGIYIRSFRDFSLDVLLAFLISIIKIFKSLRNI